MPQLAQPGDVAATALDATIDGEPDLGAIVYGFGPPAGASLRATLADGHVIELPTYQRELEAFFALPVPDGVVVESIALVDTNGAVIAVASLPPLPEQLGGTYGGAGLLATS